MNHEIEAIYHIYYKKGHYGNRITNSSKGNLILEVLGSLLREAKPRLGDLSAQPS